MNLSQSLRTNLVRTVACGAVLAGFVGAAVLSSAPANAAAPGNKLVEISNYTGYTWFLNQAGAFSGTPSSDPAPQTVAPGQTASWDLEPGSQNRFEYWWNDPTTADGLQQALMLDFSSGQNTAAAVQVNGRGTPCGQAFAEKTVVDPDGDHIDVVATAPTTIKLDNTKSSAAVARIMSSEFPRAVKDSVKFTPTDPNAEPTFKQGPATRASSIVYNESSSGVTLSSGYKASLGQSTSLGLEITGSVAVNVAGSTGKIAASIEGDLDWGSSDSTTVDTDTDIKPMQEGWLTTQLTTATLFGEVQFTTPEGVTFDVSNVGVSQGDVPNPNGNDGTQIGLAYSNVQQDINPTDAK